MPFTFSMVSPFSRHDQHAGAANCVRLQRDQRIVRLLEAERPDVRRDGDARGLGQERAPVVAGVVRDAADDALLVEELIRDRRGVAHVNSAEDERSPLVERGETGGNQLAGGGEDDRRVELRRRDVARAADPRGPELLRESLVALPVSRHHVDVGASRARDLDRDVPRRAETVESEPRPAEAGGAAREARQAEGAVADDAGAEKRRRNDVGESFGKLVDEIRLGQDRRGKAAVDGPSREFGGVAQVFTAAHAEAAGAAGPVEPPDPDAPAEERFGARPRADDRPRDLMAGNHERPYDRELALDDVEIRPADSAGRDLHEDLAGARSRIRDVFEDEGPRLDRSRSVEPEGAHPGRIASGFTQAIRT